MQDEQQKGAASSSNSNSGSMSSSEDDDEDDEDSEMKEERPEGTKQKQSHIEVPLSVIKRFFSKQDPLTAYLSKIT